MLKYDERRRELLTLLSDYGELSREILSAICGDTSHGRRTMKRLFDDKVIKESNITSSNKPRYLFHSCYITNRGKQVLTGKANTVEREEDEGKRTGSATTFERQKKESDSVMTCCVAGSIGYRKTGYPEYYPYPTDTSGYLDINPFQTDELIEINGVEYIKNHFDLKTAISLIEQNGLVFGMSQMRESFKLSTEDVNHFKFSCSTGILLTKNLPYILYHANHGYLSANKGGEENFALKAFLHLRRYGLYTEIPFGIDGYQFSSAIVFVNTKVDFNRLIRNKYNLNYDAFNQFRTVHIIQTTRNGIGLLHMLIHKEAEEIKEKVLEDLLRSGLYQRRSGTIDCAVYPTVDRNGKMVYYGIDMNMKTMQIVNLQLSEGYIQSEDIRVICLDWQKAYYESIFGKGISYASIKQEKLRKRLEVPELRFYQTMP